MRHMHAIGLEMFSICIIGLLHLSSAGISVIPARRTDVVDSARASDFNLKRPSCSIPISC